jgi:hypothetical protein
MSSIVARLGKVGSKSYYRLARELMAKTGVRFLASDIETGAGEGAGEMWGLSKPALSACGMEVLLVGFIDQNFDYDAWSVGSVGMPDEASLLRCSIDRHERARQEQTLLLGYNTLGFDYSALSSRSALLGDVQTRPWMFPSSPYRMRAEGICDMLFITSKSFRLHEAGPSLSAWLKFWGRQEFGTGKEFGSAWKNGDDQVRDLLREYNRMNLIDTAMLGLHAGALFQQDLPEGLVVDGGSVAVPYAASGYAPRPYPVLTAPLELPQAGFSYLVPITSPEAELKEKGPLGEDWAAYFKNNHFRPSDGVKDAADNFPFSTKYEGRTHPFWNRIVGYASVCSGGVTVVINRDSEEEALTGFLDEAARLRKLGPIYVPDRQDVLQLVMARASRLGLVLAPWVMDPRGTFWKDSKSFAPWQSGDSDRGFNANILARVRNWLPRAKIAIDKLPYEHDISRPPLWLEQESFDQEINAHLRVMFNYIACSPAL